MRFVCDHEGCQKTFLYRSTYEAHQRSHRGELGYSCPMEGCNRKFRTHWNQRLHTRKHFMKREFECPHPDCGQSYQRPRLMLQHRSVVHGEALSLEDVIQMPPMDPPPKNGSRGEGTHDFRVMLDSRVQTPKVAGRGSLPPSPSPSKSTLQIPDCEALNIDQSQPTSDPGKKAISFYLREPGKDEDKSNPNPRVTEKEEVVLEEEVLMTSSPEVIIGLDRIIGDLASLGPGRRLPMVHQNFFASNPQSLIFPLRNSDPFLFLPDLNDLEGLT